MQRLSLPPAALFAVALVGGTCASCNVGSGCGSGAQSSPKAGPWLTQAESEPERAAEPTAPLHEVPGPAPEDQPPLKNEKPERPWAHNTGPIKPELLIESGPLMIDTDGAVYENIDVTGYVWIDANDVTIRNFRINADGESYGINVLEGHLGVLLEDGEIFGMSSAGVLGVGLTARRLHIHDSYGDGMKIQGEGGPSLVESCFIEKLGAAPEAHADGNQTRGGANITFRYNNIFMPAPGTPKYPGAPYKSNSAFFLQLDVSNFVIENNWLTGGNYTIYCITNRGGVSVRNNVFGRENGGLPEGTADRRILSGTCDVWSGNVWEDTGRPL
jgi:hypothetical protein